MVRNILLAVVVVIIVGLGWVWMSRNDLIKDAVNTHGPGVMQVSVNLDSVNLAPFSGEAALGGLSLGQPKGWGDGDMMSLDNLSVKLRTDTLTSDHIIIDEINLDSPFMFVRVDGRKNNFQALADTLAAAAGPAEESESNLTLTIHKFTITKPVVQLEVKDLGQADGTIELADIVLTGIGTDEKGQTPAEIARHLSDVLQPQIMKAVTSTQGKNLMKKLTGSEDVETGVKETLKKGIKGLLGKKKEEDQ